MAKFKKIRTRYWRPRVDYVEIIVDSVKRYVQDSDIIVVSEKAISAAEGNLVDESKIKPGLLAKIIVIFWMRIVWGYFLGKICHFREKQIMHLRNYPLKEGMAHKQLALNRAGFLHAMKYASEGGIDINNLPFSFACLPLQEPIRNAKRICDEIRVQTGKSIAVLISDTDSTFSFYNFHFTSRPNPVEGIVSFGGFISFFLGRFLKLRQRATPLAMVGLKLCVEEVLHLAEIAHHARGYGAGRTIWEVAEKYGINFNEVTWELLDEVDHFPIVLIRR